MIERINWMIAGRIIHVIYSGNFSLPDMHQAARQIEAMVALEGQEPGVHIIQSGSGTVNFDRTIYDLRELHRITYQHPLIRQTIIIDSTDNPIIAFVGKAVPRIFKTHLQIVGSLDTALARLRQLDESLIIPA